MGSACVSGPAPAGSVAPGLGDLGDLDLHLTDPQQHLVAQRRGRPLRAGPRDQRLDGALQVVLLQARPALVEVVLDLGEVGVGSSLSMKKKTRSSTSEQSLSWGLPQLMTRPPSRPPPGRCGPGRSPASISRSWRRPRCSRDITVPIGVSMISAISLYGKPSTSARYTASRKSSGSRCRASLTSLSGRCSSASASADFRPVEECDSARASCQSSTSSAIDCCGSRCFLR